MRDQHGDQNAEGKQVKPPAGFNAADANTFDQHDVKRDQEHVGHCEFAEYFEDGEVAFVERAELDEGEGSDLCYWGNDGEEGYDDGEENVLVPKAGDAGKDGDFVEIEVRQQACAGQGCGPSDGEEDEQGEVEKAQGHGVGRWLGLGAGARGVDFWNR